MDKIRGIIALDLDGTLLNSNKELSSKNRQALYMAAAAGYEIVPTTGRFYDGMPQVIRDLPFVRYTITINGAEVKDLKNDLIVYKSEIPYEKTLEILHWLEQYPVIYDCYMDNKGWMSSSHKDQIDAFVEDYHSRIILKTLRHPVPELIQFVTNQHKPVQKIQFFTNNITLKQEMMEKLMEHHKDLCVSTSLPQNVEINQLEANKGKALLALADYLGIDKNTTYAFGDGLNDYSMIQSAGLGIAMANSSAAVLSIADKTTLACDEDGVAWGIESFILKSR